MSRTDLFFGAFFGTSAAMLVLALFGAFLLRSAGEQDKHRIACIQKHQTQSYKIIDDSIYCIREEYILLEKSE